MSPDEFAGLLQEKDGVVTEVLILPVTESSDTSAVLRLYTMLNIKAVGSFHDHPGQNRTPFTS
jgi:proteasome lid subunit RPN8/RPN11